MGTVYNIPVYAGIVNGHYDGTSLPSSYSATYNYTTANGLHDNIGANYDGQHYSTMYFTASADGAQMAYWLNNGTIYRIAKIPLGASLCESAVFVGMTWKGYHASTVPDTGYFASKYTGATAANTRFDYYTTEEEALIALGVLATTYPITYSYTNSTVSGPTEAAVGDTVVVSAVPNVDYGITDALSQIIVTNNDIAVPYTWDAANNRITFTMPDPS